MRRTNKSHNGLALVGSLLAITAANASGQGWTIVDLDPAGITKDTWISERAGDQICGWASLAGGGIWVPLQWSASGLTLLPLPPGHDTGLARGVNRAGTVVGQTGVWGGGVGTATIWANGVVTDLNTTVTGGDPLTLNVAFDIDESDRIVGLAATASGEGRAFLLEDGVVTDLGVPASLSDAWATRIASAGRIVGIGDDNLHAVMWDGMQAIDLHAPGFGHSRSVSADGDRLGRVCGTAQETDFLSQDAFVWDGGAITMLTDPATDAELSFARGMNDFGVVCGEGYSTSLYGAFVWRNGTATNLDSLLPSGSGWILYEASFVDNDGSVVGYGSYKGDPVRPFLLLPPATNGTFTPYGHGCSGSNGLEPRLVGIGVPSPERDFALLIQDSLPNALGFLILGTGTNVARVSPVCDVQVLPLLPPLVPILADPFGELFLPAFLPLGTPAFDLNFQALFFDAGAPFGISSTAALAVHFE